MPLAVVSRLTRITRSNWNCMGQDPVFQNPRTLKPYLTINSFNVGYSNAAHVYINIVSLLSNCEIQTASGKTRITVMGRCYLQLCCSSA